MKFDFVMLIQSFLTRFLQFDIHNFDQFSVFFFLMRQTYVSIIGKEYEIQAFDT